MLINRAQLAKHFGVDRRTIWSWVDRGLLPAPTTKLPNGRDAWDRSVIDKKNPLDFDISDLVPTEAKD